MNVSAFQELSRDYTGAQNDSSNTQGNQRCCEVWCFHSDALRVSSLHPNLAESNSWINKV